MSNIKVNEIRSDKDEETVLVRLKGQRSEREQ